MPGHLLPDHVKVSVECTPETGSFIRIEVWLPTENWNGDFMGTGNGGAAGALIPLMMQGPLGLGYAVANTDMGTSAGPDCGIGNKAVWKDFGYRATHLMTLAAKELIERFYGVPPKYSYFSGGSTGGQQGLMEAQRYPEDYDGILAGAPAHDRTNLHIGFIWDWLALNASEKSRFTKENAAQVVKTILKKCGDAGGRREEDAFLYHPDRIRMTEDVLEGAGLCPEQTSALMKVYRGPFNPRTSEPIYPAMVMPGSEACGLGLAERSDEESFARDFFYLFRWMFGADFDFKKFDFDRDVAKIHQELDQYLNATSPDLTAFRNRGGKLLIIHGTADPIIPYTGSIQYYEAVRREMGNVDNFFRLFLAPGMEHMSGGPGVQDIMFGFPATPKDSKHLATLALKDWVEEGIAPDCLYPVAFRDGNVMNGFLDDTYAYERPIYPYPKSDLLFGIENDVDYVAASFVSTKADVVSLRQFLNDNGGANIDIIAKIENQAGVDNIEEICEACEGIMIARGDLGVEIPFVKVPSVQKLLISKCRMLPKVRNFYSHG